MELWGFENSFLFKLKGELQVRPPTPLPPRPLTPPITPNGPVSSGQTFTNTSTTFQGTTPATDLSQVTGPSISAPGSTQVFSDLPPLGNFSPAPVLPQPPAAPLSRPFVLPSFFVLTDPLESVFAEPDRAGITASSTISSGEVVYLNAASSLKKTRPLEALFVAMAKRNIPLEVARTVMGRLAPFLADSSRSPDSFFVPRLVVSFVNTVDMREAPSIRPADEVSLQSDGGDVPMQETRVFSSLERFVSALERYQSLPHVLQSRIRQQFSNPSLTWQSFVRVVFQTGGDQAALGHSMAIGYADHSLLLRFQPQEVIRSRHDGIHTHRVSVGQPFAGRVQQAVEDGRHGASANPEMPEPPSSSSRRLGAPLLRLTEILPPVESKMVARIAMGPVGWETIKTFVAQLLALDEPLFLKSLDLIHRCLFLSNSETRARMRLVVLNLLTQIAKVMPRDVFEARYLPTLKILARDRISPEVRTQAISVALDMASDQDRSHEEMQALMIEIEFIGAVQEMLNGGAAERIKGFELLLAARFYLHPGDRQRFVGMAMEIIGKAQSADVILKALDFVLACHREHTMSVRRGLLGKSVYPQVLMAHALRTGRGVSSFTEGALKN